MFPSVLWHFNHSHLHFDALNSNTIGALKSKLLILDDYVNKTEKIGGTWTNTNSYRENEALSDIFTWNILLHNCYFAPVGERTIAITCLCVCLFASISLEPLDRSSRVFCADTLWPWLGPSLVALVCCNKLCTSGFMNDVMFGHNEPIWPLAVLQYRGGVWCLWMPCFYVEIFYNT